MRSRNSLIHYAVLLIFGSIVLQMAVEALRPLIPYAVGLLLIMGLVWAGRVIYQRYQGW